MPTKIWYSVKLRIVKPKKPNSAQRKVAKVLLSTRRYCIMRIIGQGHNLRDFQMY
jgi:small subunit ribosomal protein S12